MRTKATSPVRLSKDGDADRKVSTANPNRKENVNVAQGPRTGNTGARPGKRSEFVSIKEDRAPLADIITNAYKARGEHYKMKTTEKSGSIMPDVSPKRLKR